MQQWKQSPVQQQMYEQHDTTNVEALFQAHLSEEQYLGRVPVSTFVNVKDDIWVWSSEIANPQYRTGDNTEKLKPLPGKPHNYTWLCLVLHSQFRAFTQLTTATPEQKAILTSEENIEALEKCPVLLASTLTLSYYEPPPSTDRVYPPTTHGSVAIILATGSNTERYYSISDLSTQAQERQKHISARITELESHRTLADSATNPMPLFERDPELREMIQQLAVDYYEYHLQRQKLPTATDIFQNGAALTATCQTMQLLTFATQNAVSKEADQWTFNPGHPPYYQRGRNILEYKYNENTIITGDICNALWEQVKKQTDAQIDIAFAAISLCIRSTEPDHSAWIYAENFLKSRGIEKMTKPVVEGDQYGVRRNAGYREENYHSVGQSIFNLEKIWLSIDQPIDIDEQDRKTKKRKQRRFTYKGRFIIVKGTLTQRDLGTTSNDRGVEVAWHIAPGDWLTPFLQSPNRQVAILSEIALQYDPYRQQWEKYLSRYFFFNGHMNSKGSGCTFNRHLGTLLRDCSLETGEPDRQKRTRDRFEKAMNQLITDGFIYRWHYTDYKDGYTPSKRSWLEEWLEQKITIEIAPRQERREII